MRKRILYIRLLSKMSYKVLLLFIICIIAGTEGSAQKKDSISVYIFLSETCPICQSSTLAVKSIYGEYHDKGISFIGLFPSQNMSTDETRQKFAKKYQIPFALSADKDQRMTKRLSVSITPEVVVVRERDKAILYRGKVDNNFEAIGKRRQVVTEFYLKKALENILHNKPVDPTKTEAVGCIISKT